MIQIILLRGLIKCLEINAACFIQMKSLQEAELSELILF